MLKRYRWWWWVVAYRILVSAPVPLGLIGSWLWVGVGPRVLGKNNLGTGLEKKIFSSVRKKDFQGALF